MPNNNSFQSVLNSLNEEQRTAVEHIDGPVLAIAGPGTGKTHILTARIGRILQLTDTPPHSILCLTFTDAAVQAMRERLLNFIGAAAHRVHITTYHAFANQVIQENTDYFGRAEMEPLSDLERIEMVRQLLDGLPEGHLFKQKFNRYQYEGHLSNLFKLLKSENWTVEFVQEKIDEYLEQIPFNKDFIYKNNTKYGKKGTLKQDKVNKERERMALLSEGLKLFQRFQYQMTQRGRYDYEDMMLWVVRAFESQTWMLRNYQERYLYFLVDEFQDTNGAQLNILNKLLDYWDNPNVFVVGDDDQSIYEFQGARLRNLIDFYNNYKDNLKVVLLKNNYRSSQNILDAAKALIDHNNQRLTTQIGQLDKVLLAKNKKVASLKSKVITRQYPNRFQEVVDVVNRILAHKKAKKALDNIAIIYAKHRQILPFIQLLEQHDIPYNTRKPINILDEPIVQQLRKLLQYLQREVRMPYSGDALLYELLYAPFFKIKTSEIAHLNHLVVKQRQQDRNKAWRAIMLENINDFSAEMQSFSSFLEHMIAAADNISVPKLIEKAINQSGLLRWVLEREDKVFLLQLLATLMDFAEREALRNKRLKIGDFLSIFDSLDANYLQIPLQKNIEVEDGVHLLTAHSAKGLEFEQVYIIDAVKDNWEPRNLGARGRFMLPDTLTASGEEDAMEARRRLFYVAMTRAEKQLNISYASNDNKEKQLSRAIYIDETLLSKKIEQQSLSLEAQCLLDAQVRLLTTLEKPKINLPDKTTLQILLKDYTLSASSMNLYLQCPLSFYYQQILKVPSLQSEAATYGLAMHYALEKLFLKMKAHKQERFPSEPVFLRYFEQEMVRLRGYFSALEFKRRLAKGRNFLSALYKEYLDKWHKDVLPEFFIKNVEYRGVPIKGYIDKVEVVDNFSARILDYKTGKITAEKTAAPNEKNPLGGVYWRQLVFYKILFDNYQNNPRNASEGEIFYLDWNEKKEFVGKIVPLGKSEVETVGKLIVDTYDNIQAHRFDEGCGEEYCPWCNFVRKQQNLESLTDERVSEMDEK